jgi:hypothetical protein
MVLVFRQYFTLLVLIGVVVGFSKAIEASWEEAIPMSAADAVAIEAR